MNKPLIQDQMSETTKNYMEANAASFLVANPPYAQDHVGFDWRNLILPSAIPFLL